MCSRVVGVKDISKIFLTSYGEFVLEASTTKVSSKGQVVIPVNVRRAAGLKKGETILAMTLGDTVVLRKITNKTFRESVEPVWTRIRQLGLTEEDIDALIQEAKDQSSS